MRRDRETHRREGDRAGHLLAIQQRIGSERDIDRLLPLVMEEVSGLLGADRTAVFLLDADRMELRSRFAAGIDGDKGIVIRLKMGVIGAAILKSRTLNIVNPYEQPFFNPEVDQATGFRTQSILAVPVLDRDGKPLGGIELLNKATGRFVAADEREAEKFAQYLAAEGRLGAIGEDEAREGLAALGEKTGCERATLYRIDAAGGQLQSVYAQGMEGKPIALGLKLGIAGLVAVSGNPLVIADAHRDTRFDPSFDRNTGYRTRSILCVPIVGSGNEVIGTIQAINKQDGEFDASDLETLQGVTGIVAIALENAMLFAEQERQFRSVIEVMAATIDAKDHLTAGHSERVRDYSLGIARELGFSESDLDVLGIAALLHDYGKIGVSDQVLKKEGKLDDTEFSHIKTHVDLTKSILERMHLARKYRNVPLIAASHHETLDGSGYGRGMAGAEIPFMTKIITVADVFEALTADRHYRKAMEAEQAFAVLDKGAGKKFDPNIVAAMKRYWGKRA